MLEGGDAGRLIGADAARRARIDVGDAERPTAARRIKIGIEHAALRAELQLEAAALTDLKLGIAEMTDELLRGQPEQAPRFGLGGRYRHRLGLSDRLLRGCGAAGE